MDGDACDCVFVAFVCSDQLRIALSLHLHQRFKLSIAANNKSTKSAITAVIDSRMAVGPVSTMAAIHRQAYVYSSHAVFCWVATLCLLPILPRLRAGVAAFLRLNGRCLVTVDVLVV